MKKKVLWLTVISGFFISLDQLLKIYVHTHFSLNETSTVIPGFLNIAYVTNKGAAFGFLSEAHNTFRNLFFLSIPPIAAGVVLWLFRGLNENDNLQIFALSSIFAGAIGNYIDRLRFGFVIDFLDFHLVINQVTYSWPTFNVADMTIVVGVAILLIIMYSNPTTKQRSS